MLNYIINDNYIYNLIIIITCCIMSCCIILQIVSNCIVLCYFSAHIHSYAVYLCMMRSDVTYCISIHIYIFIVVCIILRLNFAVTKPASTAYATSRSEEVVLLEKWAAWQILEAARSRLPLSQPSSQGQKSCG